MEAFISDDEKDDVYETPTYNDDTDYEGMNFKEFVDMSALKKVIYNEEKIKKEIRKECFDNGYNPFDTLNKIYQKSNKSGNYQVKYKYSKHNEESKDGRLFVVGSVGLSSLCREFRGAVAGDLYNDIDIVNAHPCILYHICVREYRLEAKYLGKYLRHRDTLLGLLSEDCGVSKGVIKKIILSLVNNGAADFDKLKTKPVFLKKLKAELQTNIKLIINSDKYESLYKKRSKILKKEKRKNIVGSVINCVLCQYEGDILKIMINNLKYFIPDIDIAHLVLCFDGFMIPKTYGLPTGLLVNLEKQIFKVLGVNLKLAVKKFDQTIDISSYKIPSKNDEYFEEGYYWGDFESNAHGFGKRSELISHFNSNINKVMCRIYENDIFIKKISEDTPFEISNKLPSSFGHFLTQTKTGMSDTYVKFSSILRQECSSVLNTYNHFTFNPNPSSVNTEDVFNTWRGFKPDLISKKKINVNLIKPILGYIFEIWCCSDKMIFKYILSWFHHIFRYPHLKTKIAIVLFSDDKQVGKGFLINNFIIPLVFGKDMGLFTEGLDALCARFNVNLMNKLFIFCDEVASLQGLGFHEKFDKIKSRITEPSINIEIKCGPKINYPDYSNYIMATNNQYSIKIEEGDARYFITQCSSLRKGDYPYFQNMLSHFNELTASHFFSYLYHMTDIVEIRDIPLTDLKKNMMRQSLPSSRRFAYLAIDIVDDYIKLLDSSAAVEGESLDVEGSPYWISSIHANYNTDMRSYKLYDIYKSYCTTENEKLVSQRKFLNMVSKILFKKKNNYVYYRFKKPQD